MQHDYATSTKFLFHVVSASLDQEDVLYCGRWYTQGEFPTSSWASASIRLIFSGRTFSLLPGPESSRIDTWNGGTKTVVVSTRYLDDPARPGTCQSSQEAVDVEAGKAMILFSSGEPRQVEVEIILIDWASKLQIESFAMKDGDKIISLRKDPSLHRLLFIGDSITSGFCDSETEGYFPRGVLDPYPFVVQRALDTHDISVDVIAFPGISVVGEHDKKGSEAGLATKFKHMSPWMEQTFWSFKELAHGYGPTIVVIALGVNDDENDIPVERFIETYLSFLSELSSIYERSMKHLVIFSP
ncbi:hypothetical protein M422DRAFT_775603 [Sphaerobolus stellatus SS14]|nr:hypothetical protein M422DRAFT_775603 [Sphaerobolus stellatus SS14]